MNLKEIFKPLPIEILNKASRQDLLKLVMAQEKTINFFSEELEKAKLLNEELATRTLVVNQQNITIRNKLFGKSSEKRKYNKSNKKIEKKKRKYAEKRVLLPSERYPDARIIERDVEFTDSCQCQLCNEVLVDSGMVEVTEFLTVVPKEFIIIRQKRHKYRCEVCHGDIQTAPAPPRIIPG